MPYHIVPNSVRCPASKPHAVVKTSDGTVMGCHPTIEHAQRQLAALHAAEPKMSLPLGAAVDIDSLPWGR